MKVSVIRKVIALLFDAVVDAAKAGADDISLLELKNSMSEADIDEIAQAMNDEEV